MKPISDIKELHNIILEIGKTFHKICTQNKIPYYMLGGTMLGTIRHKGFIPWDDDMDFGIPRKYYSKAIQILKEQLPKEYHVTTIEDNVGIFGEIVKIVDTRTIIQEINRDTDSNEIGVFVDIFPIDYTDNNYGKLSRNMLILRLLHAQQLVMEHYSRYNIESRICKITSYIFGRFCFLKLLRKLVHKQGSYYANHSGMWGQRETVKKEIMGEPVLYDFEDTQFYGVNKPHEYLESLYGDYMQLPPEDKRHTHIEYMAYK